MPARTATKRTTRTYKPASRKPASRKPARKSSTTIVVRRAPASSAAALSVISPYDSEGYECTAGLRGYTPMTFEELQKRLLSEYACKLKALCLQKKNFTNALICKYGPKDDEENEPAATSKSEAEYLQNIDFKIQQLKFDTSQRLQKEQFRNNWTKGDVSIRQRVFGPDIEYISQLEETFGPEMGFSQRLLKGRVSQVADTESLVGDPTERALKLFRKAANSGKSNTGGAGGSAGGAGGAGGAHFGDYDYENFSDFY